MIRTVTGDIERTTTGNVLMHEHIRNVSNDMLKSFGNAWLDDAYLEDYAVGILKTMQQRFSLGIYVDGTPCDLGRDAAQLRRISEKTGVHIVASSGFYYYPGMLSCKRSAEELAELLLRECENGLDGTTVLPGILKCAAHGAMTEDMQKRIEAVAAVQKKTGLPLYAHCSHDGTLADELLAIFERHRLDPRQIVIGHASRRMDADYLETILRRGFYICIDQSNEGSEEAVAQVVMELCRRGYARQLLFSHDRAFYNDFNASGNTGIGWPASAHLQRFSYLYEKLLPALCSLGCSSEWAALFLRENALDVLDIQANRSDAL